MHRFIDPTFKDALIAELSKSADLTGTDLHNLHLEGTVDLGEVIAVASENAARVVRTHQVKQNKLSTPVPPTLGELAMEFTRQAKEARQ